MGAGDLVSKKEGGMKLIQNDHDDYVVDHDEVIGRDISQEVDSFRVTQRALAKIRKAGLPRPKHYKKGGEPLDPKLDLHLASTDNETVGRMLVEFTAASEFATYAAAIADIDRTVERNVLEFVESKVRLSKSGTVQRRSDKTNVDPRVVEARARYLEKDAIAAMTEAIQKNYERSLATISREITRRQTELESKLS